MNTLLRKYPQIDGMLAANDPMALGALDALGPNRRKRAGGRHQRQPRRRRPDQVGADGGERRLQRLHRGLRGGAAGDPAIRKETVPKEAILRTIVVDKSNVGPYEMPIEKRTCPTVDAAVAN